MITFWKQPGNKTMKRQGLDGVSMHIPVDEAKKEISLLEEMGFCIVDHGHKITAKG